MKYLEQRVEELELEVKLLKAKNKLKETKKLDYLFSHSDQEFIDQEFITKFGLETSNGHFWDSSELQNNPLDTITVNLSSIADDNIQNLNYVDSIDLPPDLPEYMPPYPDIIGSYDNFDWTTMKDWASFNQTDEIPPYPGHEEISETSLEKLDKTEKTIEKDFGKIISKFKILHHEFEMDGYGYIVSDLEYNKNVIVTNHGNPIVVNKSYLNDIIAGYKERIQDTQRALFLINE
jgi:hypothetical protein